MMKILFLISLLIISSNNQRMNVVRAMAYAYSAKDVKTNLSEPIEKWRYINSLTENEARIYKKTWNTKSSLKSNITNLVDMFFDGCCDFSFKLGKKYREVVLGQSVSNDNIMFVNNQQVVHNLIKENQNKYYSTNFLVSVGEPREFTNQMKEEIRNYIKFIAKDSVGCKLLRIATAKTIAGHLSKLIFIPLVDYSSQQLYTESPYQSRYKSLFGINFQRGIYGWQLAKQTSNETPQTFNRYSKVNFPSYRYMLFVPEILAKNPTVMAVKNTSNRFEFFYMPLPADVRLFNRITKSLHSEKPKTLSNIRARLAIKKKKFSQKLNEKFISILRIYTEANCFSEKLSPQIFQQISKLGGIKNYSNLVVNNMSQELKLSHLETLISSFYKNDEDYRSQYGITENGFDPLNESSYTSHRYHWIRTSNPITLNNYKDLFELFVKENGDFNMYSYYLSQKSSIKYPKFGINQYKCSDLPDISSKSFSEIFPESNPKLIIQNSVESALPPPYPEKKNQKKPVFNFIQ